MELEKNETENRKAATLSPGAIAGIIAAVLAVIALACFGISVCLNKCYIEFNIPSGEAVILEYGDVYDDSDITACYRGTIWNRSGIQIDVEKSGEADTKTLGEYEITYTASFRGLTASATRTIIVEDNEAPVITLVSDPDSYTNPNDEYVEEGYQAIDNYDGDLTSQVTAVEKDGVITYSVTDSSGNTGTTTRTIIYRDTVTPQITLNGSEQVTVEAGSVFEDPGCSAEDDCDGDLTASIEVEGNVDFTLPGTYELTYRVTDSSGNTATAKRTIVVEDTTAPTITLIGDVSITIDKDTEYEDPGVSATDACDGDLTNAVETINPVNTQKAGVYTIRYSVTDSSGNKAEVYRNVYVTEKEEETTAKSEDSTEKETSKKEEETTKEEEPETTTKQTNESDPQDKVIYLTFDDGPGKYTEQLLDILDKYDVKVTFFVTNQYPKYQYLIAEEYKRGHTVAIHSYSHDYSKIYTSEEDFYEDMNKMNNIIYEQTGQFATILRFPGGSSNTVSKKYCVGIMSLLTKSVENLGFQYADWNVASGDAGETTSTSKVISNVISGIKKHSVSVVLQHDIKGFSVNAVEDIIIWGLENGYTFLAMDESSPMAHHSVGN